MVFFFMVTCEPKLVYSNNWLIDCYQVMILILILQTISECFMNINSFHLTNSYN